MPPLLALIPVVQNSILVLPPAVQIAHNRERVGLLRESAGAAGERHMTRMKTLFMVAAAYSSSLEASNTSESPPLLKAHVMNTAVLEQHTTIKRRCQLRQKQTCDRSRREPLQKLPLQPLLRMHRWIRAPLSNAAPPP